MDGHIRVRTRDGEPDPGTVYLCPSVGEYPIYDESIYRVLREDQRRNRLFRQAIDAGPDLLWTLAAISAGASRVYAIEVMADSACRAEQAARAHPAADIQVIAGDSTRIELPERANVCIAEIVGCIGGSEGIAAVLADARRRHLTASAAVIPAAVRTRAGAVCLLDLLGGDAPFAPYVEAVFQQAGGPFDLRLYVGGAGPAALQSTAGAFEDLNFTAQSCAQGGDLSLEITRDGRVDGLLAWIELAVAPDDTPLDTLAEPTNWLPVYIPFTLDEPLGTQAGDLLSLHVTVSPAADGIHPGYFFRGHLTRPGPGAGIPVSAASRYSGGPFRSTLIHRRLLETRRHDGQRAPAHFASVLVFASLLVALLSVLPRIRRRKVMQSCPGEPVSGSAGGSLPLPWRCCAGGARSGRPGILPRRPSRRSPPLPAVRGPRPGRW